MNTYRILERYKSALEHTIEYVVQKRWWNTGDNCFHWDDVEKCSTLSLAHSTKEKYELIEGREIL